ncbi:hypothetical protein HYV91_03185 [Candidatus Wolfebacteria bacterium]|nr:hypothetical protein [Candidatus Wolfebacteria bacterium]
MNICIFGDSITWGASDSDKGGWVERLRVYFGEKYDANVYNLGVCGDTTDDLLKRVEVECKAREPSIIVFAIGINDSQFVHSKSDRRTSIENFKENLSKLHSAARQFTEKIAFVGWTDIYESKTKPVPWNTDRSYDNRSIQKYDEAIKRFCSEKKLKFITMNGVLTLGDLTDGVHPNSQGHEKMADIIKPVLEDFLEIR